MNSSAAANIHYSSLADRYRAAREYVARPRIGRYYITDPAGWRKRGLPDAAALRGSRGRGARPRSIARGNAEDASLLHLSIRAEQMAKLNCAPMKITLARNRNFRRYSSASFAPRGEVIPRASFPPAACSPQL